MAVDSDSIRNQVLTVIKSGGKCTSKWIVEQFEESQALKVKLQVPKLAKAGLVVGEIVDEKTGAKAWTITDKGLAELG